jgi:hypothetical protein
MFDLAEMLRVSHPPTGLPTSTCAREPRLMQMADERVEIVVAAHPKKG